MSTMQPLSPVPAPVPQPRPSKFGALAWTALILGIVGVVGSPIIFLNNLTAVVAAVGFILGVIALFGTKKVLAAIGVAICVAGIVFTVMAQGAAVRELDGIFQQIDSPSDSADSATRMVAVGDTYRGSDVDITVANPQAMTTGKYASPQQNAKAISYDVTIANHSEKPWSAGMLLLQATAGDVSAEQVFDGDLGGTPSQDVLPGKSLKFTVAFIDTPGEITVQISAMGGDKVYFTHKR